MSNPDDGAHRPSAPLVTLIEGIEPQKKKQKLVKCRSYLLALLFIVTFYQQRVRPRLTSTQSLDDNIPPKRSNVTIILVEFLTNCCSYVYYVN